MTLLEANGQAGLGRFLCHCVVWVYDFDVAVGGRNRGMVAVVVVTWVRRETNFGAICDFGKLFCGRRLVRYGGARLTSCGKQLTLGRLGCKASWHSIPLALVSSPAADFVRFTIATSSFFISSRLGRHSISDPLCASHC